MKSVGVLYRYTVVKISLYKPCGIEGYINFDPVNQFVSFDQVMFDIHACILHGSGSDIKPCH